MKGEADLIILDGVDIFVVSREQWAGRLRWVESCRGCMVGEVVENW